MGDRQDEMTIRTLQHDLAAAQARIAELEAAQTQMGRDVGKIQRGCYAAALDRAADFADKNWHLGRERLVERMRALKEPSDG